MKKVSNWIKNNKLFIAYIILSLLVSILLRLITIESFIGIGVFLFVLSVAKERLIFFFFQKSTFRNLVAPRLGVFTCEILINFVFFDKGSSDIVDCKFSLVEFVPKEDWTVVEWYDFGHIAAVFALHYDDILPHDGAEFEFRRNFHKITWILLVQMSLICF